MNLLRRIRYRLTGVIAYDCERRPLRRGDKVEIIPHVTVRDECVGMISTVVDQAPPNPKVQGGHLPWVRLSCGLNGSAECLRRLDDDGQADWRSVEKSTGWTPQPVKQPDQVTPS